MNRLRLLLALSSPELLAATAREAMREHPAPALERAAPPIPTIDPPVAERRQKRFERAPKFLRKGRR